MYSLFSIREIYELGEIKRLSPRICVGRLFLHENLFGIKDITGALWPIEFKSESKDLKSNDVIQFYGNFTETNQRFKIEKILSISNNLEHWKNRVIPEPLDIVIDKIFTSKTLYFPYSKQKTRFYNLEQKNEGFERTKQFFLNRGFFYAETPVLVPSGGMESYLHTFQTTYRDYHGRDWTLELPTSPEFALKKLIAEGIPKIFQISHAFRNNGELSPLHEPEFMMLEWYRIGGSLNDILLDTQKLVLTLASFFNVKKQIPKKWKVFRVHELFLNILNLDLNELQNQKDFYQKSQNLSFSLRETDTWNDIFCKLFMEKIEPFLKEQVACFVIGYPIQMSALATNEDNNYFYVQRAEAYLFGVEISNGYQELVNAHEFENRFQKVQIDKAGSVKYDRHFENIMKYGLPPCAGNALGIERVIALLLGIENIHVLFPIPFKSQIPIH